MECKESGQRRREHEKIGRFPVRATRARGATRTGTSGYGSKRKRLQQFADGEMSGTGARSPGALGGGGGRVVAEAIGNGQWAAGPGSARW